MADLDTSLNNFCATFGRVGFDMGDIRFSPAKAVDYPKDLPSSKELDFFYSHTESNDPPLVGGSLLLQLYTVEQLLSRQSGWRWVPVDGEEEALNPDWNPAWVVIGDKHGDALIADTSAEGTAILGGIQQNTFMMARSLAQFLEVFSRWMDCEDKEFGMESEDADANLDPKFVERLREIAASSMSTDEVDGMMKFFFS